MIVHPEILNIDGKAPVVLICDHASNHLPKEYGTLGLNPHYLATHIAWDIGAGALTRHLSDDLDCTAILARHSRLLVDTNRSLDDPSLMAESSEGKEIPGNLDLSLEERQKRLITWYEPFHEVCDEVVNAKKRQKPLVVGMHTFTPIYEHVKRDWEVAVLWNRDKRLSQALGDYFEEEGFHVGWNKPYSGKDLFCTMDIHGARHGLPHATLEIRQDLVQHENGQELFGRLVAAAFKKIIPQFS